MLKTVVCDDEAHALDLIATLLTDSGSVTLVAACQSIYQALDHINRGGVDLAVFDIEMPDLSGIAAYHKITIEPRPLLIFATAHSDYAVEAFGVDAIDYIMKPLTFARVNKAVEKALRLHRMIHAHRISRTAPPMASGDRAAKTATLENLRTEKLGGVLRIKDAGKAYFLPHSDIIWIEAAGDYSVLHMSSREITVRMTIKTLEAELPPPMFHRVHRSAIIAVAYIREITLLPKGEAHIALGFGMSVRTSRSYRDIVQQLLHDS